MRNTLTYLGVCRAIPSQLDMVIPIGKFKQTERFAHLFIERIYLTADYDDNGNLAENPKLIPIVTRFCPSYHRRTYRRRPADELPVPIQSKCVMFSIGGIAELIKRITGEVQDFDGQKGWMYGYGDEKFDVLLNGKLCNGYEWFIEHIPRLADFSHRFNYTVVNQSYEHRGRKRVKNPPEITLDFSYVRTYISSLFCEYTLTKCGDKLDVEMSETLLPCNYEHYSREDIKFITWHLDKLQKQYPGATKISITTTAMEEIVIVVELEQQQLEFVFDTTLLAAVMFVER